MARIELSPKVSGPTWLAVCSAAAAPNVKPLVYSLIAASVAAPVLLIALPGASAHGNVWSTLNSSGWAAVRMAGTVGCSGGVAASVPY